MTIRVLPGMAGGLPWVPLVDVDANIMHRRALHGAANDDQARKQLARDWRNYGAQDERAYLAMRNRMKA